LLVAENVQYRQEIAKVQSTNVQLEREREKLTSKVELLQ
jgi:cell division protein FtsB